MTKITVSAILLSLSALLLGAQDFASGSGHHSHGDQDLQVTTEANIVTYQDSKDGIDAYLEFSDFEAHGGGDSKGFIVKCQVRAFIKDSKAGVYMTPSKMALRATIVHDQFGEAIVFFPVEDNRMQADLYVKNKGEQHYLLIVEIAGDGVKEFHFHHTFN